MRIVAALGCALLAAGCVSHVGHGPRIEPGTRWNVTPSAAISSANFREDRLGFWPALWVGLGHGWTGSDDGPAVYVAGHVPALLLPWAAIAADETAEAFYKLFAGDVYVQPRRTRDSGIEYGAGVIASYSLAMPYIQVGRSGDAGVYTTQGVAFTRGQFREAVYWMPGIAARSQREDGRRAVDFYFSALLGRYAWHTGQRTGRVTEWLLTMGAVAEIRRAPE
jgi:hypothetical protein